jgi:hypothetical protein
MTPKPNLEVKKASLPTSATRRVELPLWRNGVALAVALAAAFLCWQGRVFNTQSQVGVIMQLPYRIGPLWGVSEKPDESELRLLPSDTEIERKSYDGPGGEKIVCSIVLSGGEKSSIHHPEVCLPAQGWTVQHREVIPVRMNNGANLSVMKLSLSREIIVSATRRQTVRGYYLYWFVGKDRTTPSHWERVFYTGWDRVIHKLNHRWAYISVFSLVANDQGLAPAGGDPTLDLLKKFIATSAPSFHRPGVLPGS